MGGISLTDTSLDAFVDSLHPSGEYLLQEVRLDIPDPTTAIFKATLHGPVGSQVWARAWVSNEADGTLAEAASPQMTAGDLKQDLGSIDTNNPITTSNDVRCHRMPGAASEVENYAASLQRSWSILP